MPPLSAGVWSPAGGWFADPKHWRRNTAICFLVIGAIAVPVVFPLYAAQCPEYGGAVCAPCSVVTGIRGAGVLEVCAAGSTPHVPQQTHSLAAVVQELPKAASRRCQVTRVPRESMLNFYRANKDGRSNGSVSAPCCWYSDASVCDMDCLVSARCAAPSNVQLSKVTGFQGSYIQHILQHRVQLAPSAVLCRLQSLAKGVLPAISDVQEAILVFVVLIHIRHESSCRCNQSVSNAHRIVGRKEGCYKH